MDIAGSGRLAGFTPTSGTGMDILIRAVHFTEYPIPANDPKKKSFDVVAILILDVDGNMTHITENIWGSEQQRLETKQARRNYWFPGGKTTVWRIKAMKKIVVCNFNWISSQCACVIQLDHFHNPKSTIKLKAVLSSSAEDK
ncbi:unnamed protein product, partial [Polarella glacialis]